MQEPFAHDPAILQRAAVPTATPTPKPSPRATGEAAAYPTRLVISLSRREVTVFNDGIAQTSYPVAIGREGWETPTGTFRVMDMQRHPTWINPFTGQKIPPDDPKNPLGHYWIGFWTDGNNWIGFHGTPEADSIGHAASHGCVRMHNEDIERLFQQVQLGMPVLVQR